MVLSRMEGAFTMREFTCVVTEPIGIHARPAGMVVREAKKFPETRITMIKNGKEVNCQKLMGVMSLGVKHGESVLVKAEGINEDDAIAAMEAFFKANL